jgi:PiT family inorganic phosphate transporter
VIFYILAIILVAFIFDFSNGFHDSANSIATIVGTRVLKPLPAVLWAASFNFLAAFVVGTAVAKTMGKGMIDVSLVDPNVILGGLIGAIIWNIITWYFGLPSSSSHALIGGYGGAAVAKAGFHAIIVSGWTKVILFIVLSPLIGMALGYGLMVTVMWLFHRVAPARVDRFFRAALLASSAFFSLSHGANDAQKTMGIIAGLLFSAGYLSEFSIPIWVILTAHAAIALGTLTGGWRIVHTMGSKITKLQPFGGFAAESAGAITLFTASSFGIPVSTTHTITGAIIGVGAVKRLSAVKWGVARQIVWAWLLTIPASAIIAALTYRTFALFGYR